MSGEIYNVSNWKIFIAGQITLGTDDLVEADFSGATWVEIDGWETMGGVGDAAQVVATAFINRARDVKTKGTRNAGSMENKFAYLLGLTPDPGQSALEAAEKTDENYMFKIEAPDQPAAGASPAPTTIMFAGLVTSYRLEGGGANSVQMISGTVEVNSNLVKTAATAG